MTHVGEELPLVPAGGFSALAMGNAIKWGSHGLSGIRSRVGKDLVEDEACRQLLAIFGSDHAYVQPHSGADANLVAFWSILVQRVQNKEVERLGKKSIDAF